MKFEEFKKIVLDEQYMSGYEIVYYPELDPPKIGVKRIGEDEEYRYTDEGFKKWLEDHPAFKVNVLPKYKSTENFIKILKAIKAPLNATDVDMTKQLQITKGIEKTGKIRI